MAAGGAQAQEAKLQDTVRCYNAAAVYAQQFVVANVPDSITRMMGYRDELKARAFAQGAALGQSRDAVRAGFLDDNVGYVRKFFKIDKGTMAIAPFGLAEIAHCNLDKVLGGH